MTEAEYYISNHYFCQKCHDNRFIYRYFKNINSEWIECSKNEAKIGIQYCPRCNCEERVHESAFLNPKFNRITDARNFFIDHYLGYHEYDYFYLG